MPGVYGADVGVPEVAASARRRVRAGKAKSARGAGDWEVDRVVVQKRE